MYELLTTKSVGINAAFRHRSSRGCQQHQLHLLFLIETTLDKWRRNRCKIAAADCLSRYGRLRSLPILSTVIDGTNSGSLTISIAASCESFGADVTFASP